MKILSHKWYLYKNISQSIIFVAHISEINIFVKIKHKLSFLQPKPNAINWGPFEYWSSPSLSKSWTTLAEAISAMESGQGGCHHHQLVLSPSFSLVSHYRRRLKPRLRSVSYECGPCFSSMAALVFFTHCHGFRRLEASLDHYLSPRVPTFSVNVSLYLVFVLVSAQELDQNDE